MSPEERRREVREAAIVPPPPGSVADLFAEALPDIQFMPTQGVLDVILIVSRDDAPKVLETARRHPTLKFDFLRNLSGVDFEEQGMEVVYHLYSYEYRHNVTIRARMPAEDLRIGTVAGVWRAADWFEREAAEMFGITFEGHPDPRPLLLPEDMLDHHPLRKDNPLAPLEEWQGELLGANLGRAGYIPPGSGFEAEASTESEE
jgi:NADH-quinone oxidoreductase subunit C